MFAWEPPSSSNPTKSPCRRISLVSIVRRLLLQIGGANIATRIAPLDRAYFVVARGRKSVSPHSLHICSLRSLRLALVSRCLSHSLAGEKRAFSLARPGQRRASLCSARRVGAIRDFNHLNHWLSVGLERAIPDR